MKEGISDEPLNFLDPKAAQRVLGRRPIQPFDFTNIVISIMLEHSFYIKYVYLATNPDMRKAPKVDHGFKVTSDGRLIIKDEDEEEDKPKGRRT